MAYDPTNRKHVKAAERSAKQAADEARQIVVTIMGLTQGRRWMHDRLKAASIFATTFNGNALQTAYNEGRRSVGLEILAEIMSSCPDQYVQMMREENARSSALERTFTGPEPEPELALGDPEGDDDSDRRSRVYSSGEDSGAREGRT